MGPNPRVDRTMLVSLDTVPTCSSRGRLKFRLSAAQAIQELDDPAVAEPTTA